MSAAIVAAACCCDTEPPTSVTLTALRGEFANRKWVYTWTHGYVFADTLGPPPCSAPTITEECAPSCLDLYEEVYATQPSCSGERLHEVTAGYRAATLYDQWADGITVPYLDTITEGGDAHVYREPVGGGTPVKVATGTGQSQVQRFYLATELPQMESSGVGTPFDPDTVSTGTGSLATCLLATGSTQNWAVLVRYVKRPVWTALPWAIRVVAGAAGRTIEIDGTTLTLTISGTPVAYDLTGKTVEDVKDFLDTHPSALLTATLSEAAIGEHPTTDLLAETDAQVVPTSGYLLLALAGYTLQQSVAGDAYAPRWQVGQFDLPEAPNDMPIGVSYSAVDFAGTELQFYASIAADWTALPKPAVTPFGAGAKSSSSPRSRIRPSCRLRMRRWTRSAPRAMGRPTRAGIRRSMGARGTRASRPLTPGSCRERTRPGESHVTSQALRDQIARTRALYQSRTVVTAPGPTVPIEVLAARREACASCDQLGRGACAWPCVLRARQRAPGGLSQ